VYEGVVAKGDDFMVKIKTGAYFKRLNEVYGTSIVITGNDCLGDIGLMVESEVAP
jgi:hypothetical protein